METEKLSDQRDWVNALYYGEGGTGKTTALAHLANLGRVLYIDAEAGIKRKPLRELGVNLDNIERLKLGEEGITFDRLEDTFWEIKRDLDDDPESWVGTVWDSGTEIYHALLVSIVEKRVAKADRLRKANKAVADVMLDRFFVDRDDWGVMSEQVRLLIRRFRDLPCHFGMACLERRDQDRDTGKVHVGPSITPALQSDLIGWHDVVCRTAYDGDGDLFLGTFRPDGVRQGKDRFGVVPRVMVDPTFDRIVAYVNEEITLETDPRQKALEEETAGEDAADKKTTGTALQRARARGKRAGAAQQREGE